MILTHAEPRSPQSNRLGIWVSLCLDLAGAEGREIMHRIRGDLNLWSSPVTWNKAWEVRLPVSRLHWSLSKIMKDTLLDEFWKKRREGHVSAETRDGVAEIVEASRVRGDSELLLRSLSMLAQFERDLGHDGAALQIYNEVVELRRLESDPLKLAHAVRHQADILRGMGQIEAAAGKYEETVSLYRSNPARVDLDYANALRGYALNLEFESKKEEAMGIWKEARGLYLKTAVTAGIEECDARITAIESGG